MMEILTSLFIEAQDGIFEGLVQPIIHLCGLDGLLEFAFDGTEFFLIGLLEVFGLYLILRPLEALFPAERWSSRQGVGIDVLYTLIHRLGVVPLIFFLMLQPVNDALDEVLRMHGFIPFNLERVLPGLADRPATTFMIYLFVLDFAAYWQHRLQHRLRWWWALHSLHHSQTRMSLWTDDRNHFVDDVLGSLWFSFIALLIGVPPGQFLFLAFITRFLQSLAHANIRWSFGAWGDRLLVSPWFHRIHHGVGVGHQGDQWGCNFAVLFPVWDLLFGSARFNRVLGPTGIEDQAQGVNYGSGFWEQQWLGLKRLGAALKL